MRRRLRRQIGGGLHAYLFLAQRSVERIMQLVREEMNAIGGQQIHLPPLIATTEDQAVASIARGELRSYKQLPQMWYQIQNKFRDEPRPKSGLIHA